jgi:hypothetical protein
VEDSVKRSRRLRNVQEGTPKQEKEELTGREVRRTDEDDYEEREKQDMKEKNVRIRKRRI